MTRLQATLTVEYEAKPSDYPELDNPTPQQMAAADQAQMGHADLYALAISSTTTDRITVKALP